MITYQSNIVGIGIGPSNLSLAALLHPISNLSSIFVDKQKTFQWHNGMQMPSAKLQVSYLKDLVTLVDPQNPFSFLSFLSSQKRLYQFVNANFQDVSRAEFSQYYRWACNALSSHLNFSCEAKEVTLLQNRFLVKTSKMNIGSESIVLGNGLSPFIPQFAKARLCNAVYHSSLFLEKNNNYRGKRVAVIGGGQSGAEVISYLLLDKRTLPNNITWITRRGNYLPLDDSPFVNELFTPVYSDYFYSIPLAKKKSILEKQKLFSDGISHATLNEIYRQMYEMQHIHGHKDLFSLRPETEVLDISKDNTNWNIELRNTFTNNRTFIDCDIIILCTGYQYELPNFIDPISSKIDKDSNGNLIINKDFSLNCDLPNTSKIYIQNGALHTRGVADPNLSLSSWRSATIINSIAKQKIYDISEYHSFFDWPAYTDMARSTPDLKAFEKVGSGSS